MAERRDFTLPDLGEGLEEATVSKWEVHEGDDVSLNQVLGTVETAKAEVELPSPFEGRIVWLATEGSDIQVGQPIASFEIGGAAGTSSGEGAATAEGDRPTPVLVGYGVSIDSRPPTVASLRGASTAASRRAGVDRPRAAPPVRKLARDLGVDLREVTSSRDDGVITRDDVRRTARAGTKHHPQTSEPGGADTVTKLQGVRARIASKMVRSRSTIPDATCSSEVDCSELVAMRSCLTDIPEATHFTFLLRLVVATLMKHPELNGTFDHASDSIRSSGSVHLGIAVDAPQGLLVPVIHDAQRLTTRQLTEEVRRMVAAARTNTVAPNDLIGSTFTVSNFGAFGLDDGVPVINYPEIAILGVGAIKERPVAVDGRIEARPTVRLTLCFDHRAVDGGTAGRMLSHLAGLIERPVRLVADV